MYKKCTFGVQKVYSLLFFVYKKCTFGVQKVYSLIFFVYRRCTIYVQQYIFLYFGMYKNVQRFLYKLVHCRKIQHNRLYIVLFFVTWLVHCTVPGCTFQTVHFTRKKSVQVMYNACTKSVQPEKKVYSLCTFRVPNMYNQKKKCTVCVHSVYQKCTDSIFECTFGCTESVHKCTEKGDLFNKKNAATRAEVFRYGRYRPYLSLWSSMG